MIDIVNAALDTDQHKRSQSPFSLTVTVRETQCPYKPTSLFSQDESGVPVQISFHKILEIY